MDMKLTRTAYKTDGILSVLTDINSKQVAVALEHSYDSLPKLKDGVYKCVRGTHQLHDGIPFETFEITGVVGHGGILFHVGNFNRDSDGCILLGASIATSNQGTMITSSRHTFSDFMKLQTGLTEFTLTVIG